MDLCFAVARQDHKKQGALSHHRAGCLTLRVRAMAMISLPYEPSFDDDAGDGSSSPGGRLGVFNRLELPVGTFISGVVLRGWEPSG